ncbi:DUF4340 domain-containing protein [Fontimonas sp. SYSU GA230001]|uniref:DUF4340 domain-containing protein n=1 Tax=Fontimonas sp. SYSU GA230001 TaxID=3142450 RepID=UPI0032B5E563
MKRTQLNMGLAAAALGLAVAVWVSREKPEQHPPLSPIAESDLHSIVIAHPDAKTIRLEKQNDQWRLVEPVNAPTDALEVSSLTGLARREVLRSLPLGEVQPAELGLDPPRFTVRLNDFELAFGDTEPIEYRRYVKADARVALISDPPGAALDADYSDLVSKDLLPAGVVIQRIEVPGLSVRRTDDGAGWTADAADAGPEALTAFADAWKHARAMWNARIPDGAPAGEAVRIVTDTGEIQLRVAAREPQLLIDRPDYGLRYTLSKADADKLLKLAPAPTPSPSPDVKPES